MLVEAFESGQDILSYIRNLTEYNGTADKITKGARTGNFRPAPAVWIIKDGNASFVARIAVTR